MTEVKATNRAPSKKQAIKGETLFSKEEILQNPQAFGVNYYVLVGAMADMTESHYSRSQVIAAIAAFSKRKVEQK